MDQCRIKDFNVGMNCQGSTEEGMISMARSPQGRGLRRVNRSFADEEEGRNSR